MYVDTSRSHMSGGVFRIAQDRKNSNMLNDPRVPDDRTRVSDDRTRVPDDRTRVPDDRTRVPDDRTRACYIQTVEMLCSLE